MQVELLNPKTMLGALWRGDEPGVQVRNATHREVAEQISMFPCTRARHEPDQGLSTDVATLCRELTPRASGSEGTLRAALSDYPEFVVDNDAGIVIVKEPKRLLARLWPASAVDPGL